MAVDAHLSGSSEIGHDLPRTLRSGGSLRGAQIEFLRASRGDRAAPARSTLDTSRFIGCRLFPVAAVAVVSGSLLITNILEC